MPLQFTAAHSSSRISKRSPLRRSSSSPITSRANAKPSPSKGKKTSKLRDDAANDADDGAAAYNKTHSSRLPDQGPVQPLPTSDAAGKDVPAALSHILATMFTPVPERASGMNSTRTAEVLNFRRRLPPLVTTPHLHAVSASPTAADREVAELVRRGVVRRLRIPGRGKGGARAGEEEALVLTAQWAELVRAAAGIEERTRETYAAALREHGASQTVPPGTFAPGEAAALVRAGFLTAASTPSYATAFASVAAPSASGGGAFANVGSRHASGSVAAVGGSSATLDAGGGGGGGVVAGAAGTGADARRGGSEYTLALPSIGPYLKLLSAAQAHLLHLLSRSKFREAPLSLLRERWDSAAAPTPAESSADTTGEQADDRERGGGFVGDASGPAKRRADGTTTATTTTAATILPGRTKKWRSFQGLSFDFVLAEAVGAGAVEVFDTGAVGLGVRCT